MIVGGDVPENLGGLLSVLRPATPGRWVCMSLQCLFMAYEDGTSQRYRVGEEVHCADRNLRPLRDGPGEDETLQWCPLPIKELA